MKRIRFVVENLKLNSSLLILFTLLSCSEQKMQGVIDGDDIIPPEPPFWEYFTVFGFDEDNDGVRDDYELYVNKHFDDINVRRALKYDAKVVQNLMRSTDYEEINKLFIEMHYASICIRGLGWQYQDMKIRNRNEKILNNTWRINQFNKIKKYLKVRSYPGGRLSILFELKHCNFELHDLRSILLPYLKSYRRGNGLTKEEIVEFEKIMGI